MSEFITAAFSAPIGQITALDLLIVYIVLKFVTLGAGWLKSLGEWGYGKLQERWAKYLTEDLYDQ